MQNILQEIVAHKRLEIARLYEQYDLKSLRAQFPEQFDTPLFYQRLAEARTAGQPFFITEFKRKSPSEGWINQHADLPAQILAYARAGTGAISVLTDEPFFGGTYSDLQLAADTLLHFKLQTSNAPTPLLLQKDFILDPLQIYLAKQRGADLILLIAAILEPERLDFLKKTAESLGMGALVEVHDAEELDKIQHLDFPVLGVNNRDLKTFRTALNRVNVLGRAIGRPSASTPRPSPRGEAAVSASDKPTLVVAPHCFRGWDEGEGRFLIAESGIRDYRDFQVVRNADGFLIGTGLMRSGDLGGTFAEHFQAQGRLLFKACGIRTPDMLKQSGGATLSRTPTPEFSPDFIGINFSPVSKRQASKKTCEALKTWPASNTVAVFYKNTEAEIRSVLEQFSFRAVQLYADDVTPEFVRSLQQRVFLALSVRETADLEKLEAFAGDVDLFLLDGAVPGSGQRIGAAIPVDFPYPFLLAGGLHAGNLEAVLPYKNCIGVDMASGIETDGAVDVERVRAVAAGLEGLNRIVQNK